mgnify:CR=1 FL=1
MKNLNKINLHKLSQAELAEKELSILKGGSCACVIICMESICACVEGSSGDFPSSNGNIEASGFADEAVNDVCITEQNLC